MQSYTLSYIRTYTIPSINHYYDENIDLPQSIIK